MGKFSPGTDYSSKEAKVHGIWVAASTMNGCLFVFSFLIM